MTKAASKSQSSDTGKLRIGDNWNAIRIIALSQSNPLKAVAEFVENSIDARAKRVTLIRGKERGIHYLRIKDDGEGIRRNQAGAPDFEFVATHICDSVKRSLKAEGITGLQGEFGIGLLSFWTVGEELTLTSAGADGRTYHMHLCKGEPGYRVTSRRLLVTEPGTELLIQRILPGIKQFSGEKIQWYLASELRDRIRHSGVEIRVIDRTARTEFKVEPRQFEGRLLHELTRLDGYELYPEIYLNDSRPGNAVALFRHGTRVLDNLASLPECNHAPWTSGYLQGLIDAPYLNLTPGTRSGLIHDQHYDHLLDELRPIEAKLNGFIEELRRAEEEKASRDVLRSVQKAIKEALLALPAEEYDWFEVHGSAARKPPGAGNSLTDESTSDGTPHDATATPGTEPEVIAEMEPTEEEPPQKQFFEFPGPLFSAKISPSSSIVPVAGTKNFRAVPRDRSGRVVEQDIQFRWTIIEGEGQLENVEGEIATFHAPADPGLTQIRLTVRQGQIECAAEAMVTVTQSLLPSATGREVTRRGLPSYTFEKAPGELWRSRYQPDQNVVVINNGHRDFVYVSRHKTLKLRYICRLFAKELVLKNFAGIPSADLLDRLIELSLYTDENLK